MQPKNAGVDMDAFFEKLYSGIEQAQGGLTGNAQNLQACFPKTGHASSMQIFNPEEPIWKKVVEGILDTENNCGPTAYSAMETVFSNEARFWTNAQNNPADITDRDQTYPNPWPGLANAIQERSTIQSKPFVTAFSAGLGKHRFVNGEKRGTQDWYHRSMQNILPTWRWWVETTSSDKLTFSLNWDDAYNFGTSVVVSGKLTANTDHLTRLYKTNIAIENGDKVQLVYKTANAGTIELKLADKTNPSSFTTFALNPTSTSNGWTIAEADISSMAGKTLAIVALNFKSGSTINDYNVTLGQLGILPGSYSASAKVSNLQSQNELQEEISDIRLVWDAPQSDDVDHYDIYLTRNGEKVLVGQTRNEGFYIPKFTCISGEESVEVSVVTVTKDLKESEEETLTLEYPEMTVSDVNIVASPTLVKVGEEVTLTAVANKYPDSYEWVLPTGASIVSQEGNTAKVTFSQEGSYSITVKVTNPIGVATETNTGLIEVNNTKEITNVALGKDIEDVSGEIAASGEVATNLTDGNHSTAYLPDFYAAAGQSVRFVYTFDAPKSVSRFQAYFLEPDNIESALPTEVKFEVSENGTDFDVVNTAAAGTDVSYNLPEARDTKAVAFTIGLGLWMTTPIAELEVYGKDGTAIDEITVSRVLVAPNPVNQGQKMAVAADQAESIEIYSMQGALVKAERAEETITFVSTDDLTPGIYFMVVKGADYTETVKVIVK